MRYAFRLCRIRDDRKARKILEARRVDEEHFAELENRRLNVAIEKVTPAPKF
jgi:hypothetical protein